MDRIRQAVRWALVDSLAFFAVFLLVLEVVPGAVLRLFNASATMLDIGRPAVRLTALAWLVSIPNLVVAAALQGLSLARSSMVLTMLRQALLPVLLALLLGRFGRLTLVWPAFAVAEAACIPLAARMWKRSFESVQ